MTREQLARRHDCVYVIALCDNTVTRIAHSGLIAHADAFDGTVDEKTQKLGPWAELQAERKWSK